LVVQVPTACEVIFDADISIVNAVSNSGFCPSSEVNVQSISVGTGGTAVVQTSSMNDFLPWPLVYELPPFPTTLDRTLVKVKSSAELCASDERTVTRILYNHVVQYTL